MFTVKSAPVIVFTIIFCVTVTTEAQTSTPDPAPASCALRSNTSCNECLQNVTCLWCIPTKQCIDYPVRNILPRKSLCPLNDARWGLCWVNFQILIITMSVLAGIVFIAILVCCCCCCKCERIGNKRQDAEVERQTRARKSRQKVKRKEMQLRHDEIRQKYGLAKDNPYSRMDTN
ncbi:pituitary tumor-transforming gene 1 protein-interacting protein-like [Thunnus albacares]|uniref:pituitary tumor-transforming gene 1 protein-interacting protein-like n=1 Tax=Thunnus maccoyii TaxID=8240 RepID=UPI001C4D9FF7|nr:pituitary tumor-transforming gene 1 protein-interacting protein-like [Thunnus maccoyii]XP_044220890.1 pituitary tumor-transforming gene 1 protein-interacting protein-like [Thunnus albacares]